ncbi:hypothetical protein HME9302_01685 [Alteripontixanthobacter maritimus]|uniref:RNA-binding protein AU-1/Ribonuclease E/G domain-containing protein n=2 Tax=Alteripontixanthobacter maritimus TaxID=2161824 RepID=A0A369QDW9_9SPHN|nr:hypothetical protein HME9302_01685 [Alteripontixanthobacter maritimus]
MSDGWLVEEGIAEHRAVRLENGHMVAARLEWPGRLVAGEIADAILLSRTSSSARGTARFASGEEALVDRLPSSISEGAALRLEVTRAALGERGRLKRAQARPSEAAIRPAPTLTERLGNDARIVRRFPDVVDWEDVFAAAWSGQIDYAGGALLLADTPAMTLIDVDGTARAAVVEVAKALRLLDIGGSIGIDFPTMTEKAVRKALDASLESALAGWSHERTAMNGFGFVQLVARLEGPSIFQRVTRSRTGAAARILLRRAERTEGPGTLLLTCHPALKAKLRPEWLAELARRTGRSADAVELVFEPTLALEAGHAQIVTR